jgi:hypothetical protein
LADAGADTCKAWLVQSIPTDMPHLSRIPGVLSTGSSLSLSLSSMGVCQFGEWGVGAGAAYAELVIHSW